MADQSLRPIVIKRIKKVAGGHHGGAWKIAYADFVTAMMAFFLLMWLLGSTTKAQLKGIAEYFENPLRVSLSGGEGVGEATSVIQGGGDDLTKSVGQDSQKNSAAVKQKIESKTPADLKKVETEKLKAETQAREKKNLENLKDQIAQEIEANPLLKRYKDQILLDITTEGLRIQIIDEKNRPMFSSGSAVMQPYTQAILREIGLMLNAVPNRVSLSGHTDATPFAGGEEGYSNWELSADRANASRRELLAGGMEEEKLMRVVGMSSAIPFNQEEPYSPVNRRISIIVMNRQAEQQILQEGAASVNVTDPADLETGTLR